jgi:hypothetical protein
MQLGSRVIFVRQSLTNYVIHRRIAVSGIHYLNSSVPPIADLVPLVLSINPDFLFHQCTSNSAGEMLRDMMDWLKVSEHLIVHSLILHSTQKMEPTAASEDLVALWDDYQVVLLCDQKIFHHFTQAQSEELVSFVPNDMFSRFPQMLKFFQAWRMCNDPWSRHHPASPFSIRFLLDLSWNDMRLAFIRALKENPARLQMFFAAAYAAEQCPALCMDLGRGCLRLLKKINTGELPPQMSVKAQYWLGISELIPP